MMRMLPLSVSKVVLVKLAVEVESDCIHRTGLLSRVLMNRESSELAIVMP